jgi:hypothetical protein
MNAVSTKVQLRIFSPVCPFAPFFLHRVMHWHVLGPCYAIFEYAMGIEGYVTSYLACYVRFWVQNMPGCHLRIHGWGKFGLSFGPRLLQNARTFMSWYFLVFFSALGPIQGHKVQHLLVTWGRLKIFFLFESWLSEVSFVIK